MFSFVGQLISNIYTAVAKDTTVHMQLDLFADVYSFECTSFEFISCFVCSVFITQVLKFTFSGLVTHRAIQGVVDQQHFHYCFSGVYHLWRGDVEHFHSIHDGCSAGCYQLGHRSRVFF
ncbi:Uncharacterised protein [Mycobacterium tuberculosis]|nr:Uncharacterised protein [Mycobacterium tuberculosis]